MFSKVSVMVPTRGRLPQLQTLIASYVEMTTAPETAELVFRIDADDRETLYFFRESPWPVVIGPQLDGYRSLPRFFEDLRQASTGDLLMCGNDDMVFRTPDWSSKVLEVANQYPDGLFDLGVDTLNTGVFPFSIVSRRAVDEMGFLQDARLTAGDLFLRDVMAHFGRAIPVPHVRVDHDWQGFTAAHPVLDSAYVALHQQCVREAVTSLEAVFLTEGMSHG